MVVAEVCVEKGTCMSLVQCRVSLFYFVLAVLIFQALLSQSLIIMSPVTNTDTGYEEIKFEVG
jgi:hypothetical protein